MIAIPEHLEQAVAYIADIENTPVEEWITKQILITHKEQLL